MHNFDKLTSDTYAGRKADDEWLKRINELVNLKGKVVADLGCGGGIYTLALKKLRAAKIIGIDASQTMLEGAKSFCKNEPAIMFLQGKADDQPLPDKSMDVSFSRALIHHLSALEGYLEECYRSLKPGGIVLIQNRTYEDCMIPGSKDHIRGYFFELFPRLSEVEKQRRYANELVVSKMQETGFKNITSYPLWETRKVYDSLAALEQEIINRKGRSILHQLSDHELQKLSNTIKERLQNTAPVIDRDKWTIWMGEKE